MTRSAARPRRNSALLATLALSGGLVACGATDAGDAAERSRQATAREARQALEQLDGATYEPGAGAARTSRGDGARWGTPDGASPSEPSANRSVERGIDLDDDPVRIRAEGVGNTPEQARERAFESARVEASRVRSVRVSSETTLAEDTQSLSSSDGFDAAVSSSSLSARSRQRTAAVLRGVAPRLLDSRRLETGEFVATAELAVPREQLVPQRVLAELARADAPLAEFEGFRLRALQREDWDALAQAEQQLLELDPSAGRVLDLTLTQERRGRLLAALQLVERALEEYPAESALLEARRADLARRLVPVEREVEDFLRALDGQGEDLRLRVDREEVAFRRTQVLRGTLPAGHDLLLFWIDGEQLTAWAHYPAGSWSTQDYLIDDPQAWRAGTVRCLALSGPQLAASWTPTLDVDLGAAARGELSARAALDDALGLVRELAAAPEVAARVLRWQHLERNP